MKRKVLIGIIFVCLAVCILCIVSNVSAKEEVATVIDIEGRETTVHDLYLRGDCVAERWDPGPRLGRGYWKCVRYETKRSMELDMGKSVFLTVPFSDISEMEFEWGETRDEDIVTITALTVEEITGRPVVSTLWDFKGKVDFGDFGFGDFSLRMCNTKKIIFSHTRTPTSPTPVATTLIIPSTEIQIQGFSIQDIQKSSENAPKIHIEPLEEQKLPDTTVVLSGSASTDSGIESVTVNGQYAGTEYWSAPIDLALGDNNIVIVATGKDGNTTVENIRLPAFSSFTPDSKSWISKYIIPNILPLLILLLGTGLLTELIRRYRKRRHP